ncbi:carboxypeptidase Y-deficient [Dinochytrium kinnereticum]|nr:carboxypeptidase Y-deficient [Dinochytrium kinnereticum]
MQNTAQKATLSFDRLDKAITGAVGGRGGFELNDTNGSGPSSPTGLSSTPEQYDSNGILNVLAAGPVGETAIGEEAVTRKHWHKGNPSGVDMRLAVEDAKHDPVKGVWCRVCVSRHKTSSYLKHRKGLVDQVNLEANRIMKRLEKLSSLYTEDNSVANKRSSISTMTALGKRHIDQSVVSWEEDSAVSKCPYCTRQEAAAIDAGPPPVVKLYQAICKNKAAVEELLPKFNSMILALKNADEIKAEDREYVMASRYRKTLLDHFSEIEKIGKRIKLLPTESPSLRKLQDNIHVSSVQYLQNNMFTLHMMPRTTKELQFHDTNGKIPLSAEDQRRLESARTTLAAMETQEEQLRAFIEDATRRRKLEDVAMLKEALSEVVTEVDRVKREVEILMSGESESPGNKR